MMSTSEQMTQARADVKKIEPYCWAIIIAGVSFISYALYVG